MSVTSSIERPLRACSARAMTNEMGTLSGDSASIARSVSMDT